jgi:predicted flavoprotein YhiN
MLSKENDQYLVSTETDTIFIRVFNCLQLVDCLFLRIGATSFGYEIAKKFDHNIIETLPALVPLTFSEKILEMCKELTGLSVEAVSLF